MGEHAMADQSITLTLPRATYDALRRRASRGHRSVEAEALRVVEAGLLDEWPLPLDLAATLEAMALLTDDALWQTTQASLSDAEKVLLETLNDKRDHNGLTEAERKTLADLAAHQGRIVAMRAEAVALLHRRGHDVSTLVARA
jgi:plasmid stability protein